MSFLTDRLVGPGRLKEVNIWRYSAPNELLPIGIFPITLRKSKIELVRQIVITKICSSSRLKFYKCSILESSMSDLFCCDLKCFFLGTALPCVSSVNIIYRFLSNYPTQRLRNPSFGSTSGTIRCPQIRTPFRPRPSFSSIRKIRRPGSSRTSAAVPATCFRVRHSTTSCP